MTNTSPHTHPFVTDTPQAGKEEQRLLTWDAYWPPEAAHRAKDYLELFLRAAEAAHLALPEYFVFRAGQIFFHEGHLQEVRLSGSVYEKAWITRTPPKLTENPERKLILDPHDAGRDYLSALVIEEAPGRQGFAIAWDVRTHGESLLSMLQAQPPTLPATSPSLFPNGKAHPMASSLVMWESGNLLTRAKDLPWQPDVEGRLTYTRTARSGKGKVVFWVTDDPEKQYPEALAGEAALAVLNTFDIRAVCMHLIYAAHVTTLNRPWAEEFVIDDTQIFRYLGLERRTDLNRQEKLALIAKVAQQPAQLLVYLYWPHHAKKDAFAIEQSRLWDIAITYYGQQDLYGEMQGTGLTIRGRAGLWAKYFLNRSGSKEKNAFYEYGYLPHKLLKTVTSSWQKHTGAARLMVWLLFKTRVGRDQRIAVFTLLEVAYGKETVDAAQRDRKLRNSLATRWEGDLLVLHEDGWHIQFDVHTYPPELWPNWAGRTTLERSAGYWERLRQASLIIFPPHEVDVALAALEKNNAPPRHIFMGSSSTAQPEMCVAPTRTEIRAARIAQGWTQHDLATAVGKSQAWVALIENGARQVHPRDLPRLREVLRL
jgi:DNA-binding XRE family transcriptional regulator